MEKAFRFIGLVILTIVCCGVTACGGDDDDINANGNASLKVKDFPFDGVYARY